MTSIINAEIQYSGTQFTTSFATTGTKQDLIDDIETALLNGGAGWTTVSGSGTTNLLMLSGTTPDGLQIRARFRDLAGTGVQVYMENADSTLADTIDINHGATLLATLGRTYTVIGSTYQFIIYATGLDRGFVWVGIPDIPTFIAGTSEAGFLIANSISQADGSNRSTIQTTGPAMFVSNNSGNSELLLNGNYRSTTNATNQGSGNVIGSPRLIINGIMANYDYTKASPTGYRWYDDTVMTGDVFIAWGLVNGGSEAKIVGQIYDAIFIGDAVAAGITATFDTNLFHNVTENNSGSAATIPSGGIWFAVN